MPLVIAYEDAKRNELRHEGNKIGVTGGATLTPFFGSHYTRGQASSVQIEGHDNIRELPDAIFSQFDPCKASRAHFHKNDQFQVIIGGKGKLGRHSLLPYSVHFSRAYTPYGPLVSDSESGMVLFVLRAHPDPGSQRLPKELAQLKQIRNRQPWQITRRVSLSTTQSATQGPDIVLQKDPEICDQQGLAAYTLRMKPNTKACAPDHSHGEGQFLIFIKGSLLHNNKEHQALALAFAYPDEGSFEIHAGPQGLEALILNFPDSKERAKRASTRAQVATQSRTWQCALCAFFYDEGKGLPEEGIAPGTRWQDVPETWTCPNCGSSKADFQMVAL